MLSPSDYSRPIPLAAIIAPICILLSIILIDTAPVDFTIENLFYTPGDGFIGRHIWLLETFMHDGLKKAVKGFALLGAIAWIISLFRDSWQHWRRPLGYFTLAVSITASIVMPIKTLTGIQCPWDLKVYGGHYTHTSLLEPLPPGEEGGKCWPGGHASTGFALFAIYFMLRDRRPRIAKRVLWAVIIFGSVLGFSRMLQGAHFLSHNIATGMIDWLVCLGCYRAVLYRKPPQGALPATDVDATQ